MGNLSQRGQPRADFDTYELESGVDIRMTKARAMGLVALMEDRERYDRVVFDQVPMVQPVAGEWTTPFTLTAGDVDYLRGSLSKEEMEVVHMFVGRINGTLKTRLRNWYVETTGQDSTQDGTHFPSHVRLINKKQVDPEIKAQNLIQHAAESSGFIQPVTTPGEHALVVSDLFVEFAQYSWTINNIVHLATPIREAQQFLERPETRELFQNRKLGSASLRRMQQTLDAGAKSIVGGPTLNGLVGDFVGRLINNVSRAVLGLNPRIALYQVVSVLQASVMLPGTAIRKALTEGAMIDSKIDERINRASGYMWQRRMASAMNMLNESTPTGQSLYGLQPEGEWAMWGIRTMDQMVMRTIWRAAEVAHADKPPEEREALVRDLAERTVQQTQPTNDWLHSSGIALESQGNPALRLFSMFRAQRAKNMNIIMTSWMRGIRGEGWSRNGRNMAITIVLQSLGIVAIRQLWDEMFRLLLGGTRRRTDPEMPQRWASDLFGVATGNMMFGEFYAFFIQKMLAPDSRVFVPEVSPVTGIAQDMFVAFSRLRNNLDPDSEEFWRGLSDIVAAGGTMGGYPQFVTPVRELRRAYEASQDRASPKISF